MNEGFYFNDEDDEEYEEEDEGILPGYNFRSPEVVPLGRDIASGLLVQLSVPMMNRHGYIAGATGTGKTMTIRQIIEWLSQNGVPCVLSDGKGDLSGMARRGSLNDKLLKRARSLGQVDGEDEWWCPTDLPLDFLALGGNGIGVPVRVPVGTFDYRSLAKVIGLTAPQTNAFATAFLAAKNVTAGDMDDLEDLAAFVRGVRDDPDSGVSDSVCDRILNRVKVFGAENPGLFGAPGFDVMDLVKTMDGWGKVSVIDSSRLADTPDVLTTFLLWILDQMSKHLPEVGDTGLPKCVVFLDEAHLMFEGAPKEFILGMVRKIKTLRSKGVGVFFISQSASDIPPKILSQCANRVQHALRANTWEEQRAVERTAKTFPKSAVYDISERLTKMRTGDALVCVMDDNGVPTPPSVCRMYVPRTSVEVLSDEEIESHVANSELFMKYQDLEEEYERMRKRAGSVPVARIVQAVTAAPKAVVGGPSAITKVHALMDKLAAGAAAREPQDAVPPQQAPAVHDPWGK